MRQGSMNGKGAVFQVSDAKWVAKVCLGVDDGGRPIIKQFSGKTEAIAKKTPRFQKEHRLHRKTYSEHGYRESLFHRLDERISIPQTEAFEL